MYVINQKEARKQLQKKPLLIIGIMTGTSLDGIDAAAAYFSLDNNCRPILKPIDTWYFPYSKTNKREAERLLHEHVSISEVAVFHAKYAIEVSRCLQTIAEQLPYISAVGIHGQTIWHNPDHEYPHTLQLGDGEYLAKLLGVPVVWNFRAGDTALGGKGAPLVPHFDRFMFAHEEDTVVALNIGGMANITVIPPKFSDNAVVAFDTGPGNILIDACSEFYFHKKYDENGNFASKGNIIPSLQNNLRQFPYFRQYPPKTTGREMFNNAMISEILANANFSPFDVMATITDLTAWSIAIHIKQYASNAKKAVVGGGGWHNVELMRMLREYAPNCQFVSSDEYQIPSDGKEAYCFAYLTFLRLMGLSGNIPTATGAGREAVLGALSLP